jgi:hypothetical protein
MKQSCATPKRLRKNSVPIPRGLPRGASSIPDTIDSDVPQELRNVSERLSVGRGMIPVHTGKKSGYTGKKSVYSGKKSVYTGKKSRTPGKKSA